MKVTREKAEENREKVLLAAGMLFRQRGIDGVSVADIMKAAGLTHGAFYGQFKSKDDLAAQSIARALSNKRQAWMALEDDGKPFEAVVKGYLTAKHRDCPANGCAFAAIGDELARGSPVVRHAVTTEFRILIESLSGLAPGRSRAERRKRALAAYSSMIGALLLSRVVDDPEMSAEILAASEHFLTSGSETGACDAAPKKRIG